MTKAKTQQIETSAYHEPTLTIPADFTALHIASICAELYSCTAPTGLMDEFTICEEGDFAMYNVHDQFDMAEHYFHTAFSIGESVKRNPQYSVQEAYDAAIEISADTVVREDVLSDVLLAIENYKGKNDEYIQEDYAMLSEHAAERKAWKIAELEGELARFKASQSKASSGASVIAGFVLSSRGAQVSYGILRQWSSIDEYIALSYFLEYFSWQKKYAQKSAENLAKIKKAKKRYHMEIGRYGPLTT